MGQGQCPAVDVRAAAIGVCAAEDERADAVHSGTMPGPLMLPLIVKVSVALLKVASVLLAKARFAEIL